MYCLVCNWKRYLYHQQLYYNGTVYNIFDVKYLIFFGQKHLQYNKTVDKLWETLNVD